MERIPPIRHALAAAAMILAATPAAADSLKLFGDRYWIALASRQSASPMPKR